MDLTTEVPEMERCGTVLLRLLISAEGMLLESSLFAGPGSRFDGVASRGELGTEADPFPRTTYVLIGGLDELK